MARAIHRASRLYRDSKRSARPRTAGGIPSDGWRDPAPRIGDRSTPAISRGPRRSSPQRKASSPAHVQTYRVIPTGLPDLKNLEEAIARILGAASESITEPPCVNGGVRDRSRLSGRACQCGILPAMASDQAPRVEGHDGLMWIRGSGVCRDWNGIRYKLGMSGKNVGAKQLSMNVATIPPGGVAGAHIHVDFEVMLYILEGRVRHEYGEGLDRARRSRGRRLHLHRPRRPARGLQPQRHRTGRRRRRALERRRMGQHRAVRARSEAARGGGKERTREARNEDGLAPLVIALVLG